MEINIKPINKEDYKLTAGMIMEFFNYHRKLTNAPREFWETEEEAFEDLKAWLKEDEVYTIFLAENKVGFIHLRFGGQNVAWLEDIYVAEDYRGKGIGRRAIAEVDKLMEGRNIKSMFVDVIPRNINAMKLYRNCGFDHLNMIELRKNYDHNLDKNDHVEILGMDFIKY